jgi:uncharacterized protein YheU (UPF0270 family)
MENRPKEPLEDGVEILPELLQPDTFEEMIKEFILREGTDYGNEEVSLAKKIEQVKRQFEKNDLKIVFDLVTETCSIIPRR